MTSGLTICCALFRAGGVPALFCGAPPRRTGMLCSCRVRRHLVDGGVKLGGDLGGPYRVPTAAARRYEPVSGVTAPVHRSRQAQMLIHKNRRRVDISYPLILRQMVVAAVGSGEQERARIQDNPHRSKDWSIAANS